VKFGVGDLAHRLRCGRRRHLIRHCPAAASRPTLRWCCPPVLPGVGATLADSPP
jgi:hypothetical protein